jgi:hypothetical protein
MSSAGSAARGLREQVSAGECHRNAAERKPAHHPHVQFAAVEPDSRPVANQLRDREDGNRLTNPEGGDECRQQDGRAAASGDGGQRRGRQRDDPDPYRLCQAHDAHVLTLHQWHENPPVHSPRLHVSSLACQKNDPESLYRVYSGTRYTGTASLAGTSLGEWQWEVRSPRPGAGTVLIDPLSPEGAAT